MGEACTAAGNNCKCAGVLSGLTSVDCGLCRLLNLSCFVCGVWFVQRSDKEKEQAAVDEVTRQGEVDKIMQRATDVSSRYTEKLRLLKAQFVEVDASEWPDETNLYR